MSAATTTKVDDLRGQYIAMRKMYGELVGTLYPSITYNALIRLRGEIAKAGGNLDNLPLVPPPRADGSAPYVQPYPN